jgi:hypothetical protein
MTQRFGRRAGLLALLAGLSACAAPTPAPVVPAVPELTGDPDPEDVYSPGPIAWAELTDEHKRRARAALGRMGEDVPDDDAELQARWLIMSPAQQRYVIRRPPPPPRPARPVARARSRAPTRRTPPPPPRRTTPRRRQTQ